MASLRRVSVILLAFVAGNLLAVHVLIAGKILSDFNNFDHYFTTEIWSPAEAYALVVLVSTLGACLISLAPTVFVLTFTEMLRIRSVWFYALAGGLGAFLFDVACTRYELIGMRSFCVELSFSELATVTIAGMIAGYVFWRIAGNGAGNWRGKGSSKILALD
jgi:hypothetical protein